MEEKPIEKPPEGPPRTLGIPPEEPPEPPPQIAGNQPLEPVKESNPKYPASGNSVWVRQERIPNKFQRFMQKWLLGIKWTKVKDE
jgi:hypothetical protein